MKKQIHTVMVPRLNEKHKNRMKLNENGRIFFLNAHNVFHNENNNKCYKTKRKKCRRLQSFVEYRVLLIIRHKEI